MTDLKLCHGYAKNEFPNIKLQLREDVGKISIVGVGMRTHAGVAS